MTIAISIACFLSSIYGVIQFLDYDPISWANVDERLKITSTFGNPVFFSGYLVSVFPLILAGFLSQSKNLSAKKTFLEKCFLAFLFVVMALMLFNLYATKTRGAWLGFVFSILCVTVLIYLEFIVKHRIKFIVSAFCFIVIFGVFVGCKYKHPINQLLYLLKQKGDIAVALTDANKGDPIGRSYFINTRGGQSILYRVIQYKSAIEMIRDYPLTGIGPDLLGPVLPRYAFNHYKQSPSTPEFENVLGIHNDILDKATTCGVIGLGTYLWIFGAFILFIKRHFPRSEKRAVHPCINLPLSPPPEGDRGRTFSLAVRGTGGGIQGDNEYSPPLVGGGALLRNRLILSGLLACLVGYFVQQQFNVIEYTITLHFWIFLAASIALVNSMEEKDSPARSAIKEQVSQKKPNIRTIKRALPVPLFYSCYLPIIGILVYGLCYLINIYKADVIHKKGSDFLAFATTHQESGNELDRNPYWQKGLEYYTASIFYNPRQTIYRYQLCDAYLFMLRKDLDNIDLIKQTIKEAEEIIRIDPNEDFAFIHLANAYDLLEHNTKADYSNKIIRYCEKAISINPYKASYYDCLGTYYMKRGLYDKAILSFKQILHMKPDYPKLTEKLENAHKPLIKKLIAQNQLNEAEALLGEILPLSNDIYFKKLKILIYGKRGMWEDVIKESEQILLAKSDDIDAYQNIATAYYVMKRYDDAKKILEKILQLSSNDQPAKDLLQTVNAVIKNAAN
ncbi:MAG: O-antigen ligase family protein [Candidatus Brocadia sp.]|nr:O-antigen ligase family protein [Candidatus Brocadia sp.]